MNYFIITGASRGIGEAIAKILCKPENVLICLSRNSNQKLLDVAKSKKCTMHYHVFDLENVREIDALVDTLFEYVEFENANALYLINNAGLIQPIMPLEKCESAKVISSVHVNYIAPTLLASNFIRKTQQFKQRKLIVNISSGAGVNPYHGWSCYCSTKAALNMLTQCISLEQANLTHPVEVISIFPGIIETHMQNEIRSAAKDDFNSLDFFVDFKEKNKLKTPEFAAEKIVDLMCGGEFVCGKFYDFIEL